jgi:cold shock CspA family protein
MRIEGTLAKWNDDRGFGFIAPRQGGPEVFVHISAFPKDGHRPAIGELLSFEIEADSNGKKRARNLLRPGRPSAHVARQQAPSRRTEGQGILGRAIPFALLAGLAFYGYGEYSRPVAPLPAVDAQAEQPRAEAAMPSFHCDGRTHCSQMTSCAEATYFLRNCPGTKMDGDHDGIPCEEQLCNSPFPR